MKNNIKIKIIAPASKSEDIDLVISELKNNLAQENIQLFLSDGIFAGDSLPFFAASKEVRLRDLIEAITSEDYDIIWAARGGYGCANLIEKCMNLEPGKAILIGFSDVTALHLLYNQQYKLPSIHGPVITSFVKNNESFEIFNSILKKPSQSYELKPISNNSSLGISGELGGGNLTVITTLIGTELSPQYNGKILLLEDVNEKSYQIHRHLMHLKHSGVLRGVEALLFGEFSLSDNFVNNTIEVFCKNEINVPSYFIDSIGHGNVNKPIIFGSKSYIENNFLEVANPFLRYT